MTYEEQTEAVPFSPEMEAAFLQLALNRAPAELQQLSSAQDKNEKFVHLPSAAAAAFHLGLYSEARAYAETALALAPQFEGTWNYGNAVHLGHTVLGLLALNEGNDSLACSELYESGSTPGSPQLNTFGPTMQLAKALLRKGHVVPVLEYLTQCRAFWEMGGKWLDLWEQKVKAGLVPNFFQHTHA